MTLKSKSSFLKKSKVIAKSLFSFFIPGGLLFLVTAIILHLKILDKLLPGLALVYPFIAFGAGVLVGLYFKRIWLLFVILILALADKLLLHFAADIAVSMAGGLLMYNAVSLLLPFNLYVFTLMKKRGAMTQESIWFFGGILLQGCGVALIYQSQNLGFGAFLEYSFIKWPLLEHLPLPQLASFAFGIVFLYFLVCYIRTRGAIERAYIWALISIFSALVVNRNGQASSIYLTTAALIFVISVIENIYIEAFQDELTGLPTRKILHGTLYNLGTGYTVAMIEIDNFKKLKENHGRRVSKQILRMVGSKIASVTGGGMPFRYGGEVFIVVFPAMFLQDTLSHLEELRKAIRESGSILRNQKSPRKRPKRLKRVEILANRVPATVSIGVAERSDLDMSPQQAIKAAEKALNLAKREGHDRMYPTHVTVEFEQL